MTQRTVALVALALVMGLLTSTVVYLQLTRPSAPLPVDKTAVVVAKRDLPARTRTSADDFTTQEYPKDALPPQAILSIADAVNRTARVEIKAGDPVLAVLLTEHGDDPITDLIRPGMRAFAIRVVDSSTIVEGLIRPGSKVDVCLSMRSQDDAERKEDGGAIARTLLENVEILAVGKQVEANRDKAADDRARSVTVLVRPRDANQLALAQNHGALHLTLRGNHREETTPVGDERIDLKELKGETVKLYGPTVPSPAAPVVAAVVEKPVVIVPPKPTIKAVEYLEIHGRERTLGRFTYPVEPESLLPEPATDEKD